MMEWNCSEVEYRNVYSLMFRSSTAFDSYRTNFNLEHIAIIVLENYVYIWTEDMPLKHVATIDYLTEV